VIFSVHIGTGNGAFHDDDEADTYNPGPELARLLRELADRVADLPGGLAVDQPLRLHDINGNRVGFAVLNAEGIGMGERE